MKENKTPADLAFCVLNGVDDIATRLAWIQQTLFMVLEHIEDAENMTTALRDNDNVRLLAFARRWQLYDDVLHGLWNSLDDLKAFIESKNEKDWSRYWETREAEEATA